MIEVPETQIRRCDPGGALYAPDVFSCLVVATRLRGVGSGYMGHFYSTAGDCPIAKTQEMLQAAAEEAGDPARVSVWLAGCATTPWDKQEILAVRADAAEAVRAFGCVLRRELWLPPGYVINRAVLRCATSKFTARFVHEAQWGDI